MHRWSFTMSQNIKASINMTMEDIYFPVCFIEDIEEKTVAFWCKVLKIIL